MGVTKTTKTSSSRACLHLFDCQQDYGKQTEQISMESCGVVERDLRRSTLDFGADPDQKADPGMFLSLSTNIVRLGISNIFIDSSGSNSWILMKRRLIFISV